MQDRRPGVPMQDIKTIHQSGMGTPGPRSSTASEWNKLTQPKLMEQTLLSKANRTKSPSRGSLHQRTDLAEQNRQRGKISRSLLDIAHGIARPRHRSRVDLLPLRHP